MEEAGTAAVGDIANTFASVAPIAKSRLHAVVFRELIGFNVADPEARVAAVRAEIAALPSRHHRRRGTALAHATATATLTPPVRVTLAPHAPYSVSPGLFRAIASDPETARGVSSVHLGESLDEVRFLDSGDGAFRALLERVGAWNPSWEVPKCGPAEYLARLGVLSPRLLAVHGVRLRDDELKLLARAWDDAGDVSAQQRVGGIGQSADRAFLCVGRACRGRHRQPRQRDRPEHLQRDRADASHRAARAARASARQRDASKARAPSASISSASSAAGAHARLITVDLPATLRDVETYLVEGIDPGQIAWVPANPADAKASRADPR